MEQTQQPKYFIVESTVLPEIYLKVAQAKRLLETGQEQTVNAAARRAGISRSAFYKYKDAIRPFEDMLHGRIVTIQILLRNERGALSSVLNLLADRGGNVLTINQAIPGGGAAAVTVGLETSGLSAGLEELLCALRERPEVIRCEVPAG
ncbi:MAG: ACT domain-containing protein [Oscillospiraceae bacterium]|nr:ACT domain-containing protein [Oscillospiraceae bacterium]